MDEGNVTIQLNGQDVEGYFAPTGQPDYADRIEGQPVPVGLLSLKSTKELPIGQPLIAVAADGRDYEFVVTTRTGDVYAIFIYGPK